MKKLRVVELWVEGRVWEGPSSSGWTWFWMEVLLRGSVFEKMFLRRKGDFVTIFCTWEWGRGGEGGEGVGAGAAASAG